MISRRVFLKNGAFALVSVGFAPSFLARTAFAGQTGAKRLICIFQRGAVDGLNMIVPYGEGDYYRTRPTIAIPRPTAGSEAGDLSINLDGFFALHPRLRPLLPFWQQRELAIVHACGSPDSTRSHFDAQDYMESGTPGVKSTQDGWLNRYLQARKTESDASFRAVAIGQQLPRALHGKASAVAMAQIAQFGVGPGNAAVARGLGRGGQGRGQGRGVGRGRAMGAIDAAAALNSSFEEQYAAAADSVLNGVGRDAFDAMRTLKTADPARYQPEHGADYPRTAFGQALRQIAQLSKADVGLEIAFADLGGWDTHVNQGGAQGQLAVRLDDFARGIAALVTDLGPRMADTIVLTMSEFGRAVAENGSRGTDHGHGNAMIAIGGGVRGGRVYGKWPGLAADKRFEGRDLAVTTDFRDVFGEIITRHLGLADTRSIFPGYTVRESAFPGILG